MLTGVLLMRYGACLIGLKQYERAEGVLLESYDILGSKLERGHRRVQAVLSALVDFYDARGKSDRAAEYRALLSGASPP